MLKNRQDACFTKINFSCGVGILPVPQKLIFLVGWASCPPLKGLLKRVQYRSYYNFFCHRKFQSSKISNCWPSDSLLPFFLTPFRRPIAILLCFSICFITCLARSITDGGKPANLPASIP